MVELRIDVAKSLEARGCVTCPPVTPTCPDCADDEICSMTLATCNTCASRTCIKNQNLAMGSTGSGPSGGGGGGGGPNIGGIVGGIIGGVVVIAVATWLIYRFFIKGRRQQYDVDDPFEDEIQEYPQPEKSSDNPSQLTNRASVLTTSTAMTGRTTGTRSSIPIAYIPGVETTFQEDVPPVPPIPAATSSSGTPSLNSSVHSPYSDNVRDHYFTLAEKRDSSWSGYTDASSIRESTYRQSITPSLMRENVTSTVFNEDLAFRPQPAQRAYSGRANVVSVSTRSSPSTPTHSVGIPDVPSIDFNKYHGRPATTSRRPNIDSVVEEQEPPEADHRFSTASASTTASSMKPGITAAIREATRRASRAPLHGGLGAPRTPKPQNPFSDANTVREDED